LSVILQADAWQFKWITRWDDVWLPSFVDQWKEWVERSPTAHVFFEPCIVRAWYKTYRSLRKIEPRFLVANNSSRCTVFYPLILDRCGWKDSWLRILRPIGFNEFDYHDPVFHDLQNAKNHLTFWNALFRELKSNMSDVDLVIIPRVREQSTAGYKGFQQTNLSAFLDLTEFRSFDEFAQQLHKQVRQELRRQPRRLEKLGSLSLTVFGKNERDLALGILPRFLEAHTLRWPGAYKAQDFFKNLIKYALPEGILHLSVLESCDAPISWHIGFLHKRRFYYYVPAFDQTMATYSPGKVHLGKLIQRAFQKDVNTFDLLTGQEGYKQQWSKKSIELYSSEVPVPGVLHTLLRKSQALLRGTAKLAGRVQ
jgi:CelD/BcsL family acetyltransferase involved in cellulose biosynthesis